MGCISDFGTGFAARISGLAILMAMPLTANASAAEAPAVAAPAVAASINVSISNLRSTKGDVLVCLSTNPKYFPDCRKDVKARKIKVAAANAQSVKIDGVKPGTYAIALIHDENANGKMDLRLFLPREGFGFSRNPKIGMGPPKFKSAQFTMGAEDAQYAVKMKYIL
ncbi:MAG: hypothetical protein Pars2KO_01660 [Parasphingorhabdus sp.]